VVARRFWGSYISGPARKENTKLKKKRGNVGEPFDKGYSGHSKGGESTDLWSQQKGGSFFAGRTIEGGGTRKTVTASRKEKKIRKTPQEKKNNKT